WAPVISGFAYTSTPQHPDGYVNAVPGLGGGVDSRNGTRIRLDLLRKVRGDLLEYIREEQYRLCGYEGLNNRTCRNAALLGFEEGEFQVNFRGNVLSFDPRSPTADVLPEYIGRDRKTRKQDGYKTLLKRVNLLPMFSAMSRMERLFGAPQ